MSFTEERPREARQGLAQHAHDVGEAQCAHCGAPMLPDQEWCLECGAARTLIHRPPDWRIGATAVALVLVLTVAGFAIALIDLSSSANRESLASGPQSRTTTQAAARRPTGRPRRAAIPPGITTWAVGLSGWTVVLARSGRHAGADAVARRFAGRGMSVGVLDSSQHPTMTPGSWIVFSGRYPNHQQAATAAAKLRARGVKSARSRQVAPPGGL